MSQIKISIEVKDGKTVLRAFKNLNVPLFDTLKENVEKYGEEMLHLCFIGTSGKVNIQNKIRTYASMTDDDGEYENDEKAVIAFATDCLVTVGTGSELQSERASIMAKMTDEQQEELNKAKALLENMEKQVKGNIANRKAKREEKDDAQGS